MLQRHAKYCAAITADTKKCECQPVVQIVAGRCSLESSAQACRGHSLTLCLQHKQHGVKQGPLLLPMCPQDA